jgi:hypothetical protein
MSADISPRLKNLISACWDDDPLNRPTFADLIADNVSDLFAARAQLSVLRRVHLGGLHKRLHGESSLEREVLSQGNLLNSQRTVDRHVGGVFGRVPCNPPRAQESAPSRRRQNRVPEDDLTQVASRS